MWKVAECGVGLIREAGGDLAGTRQNESPWYRYVLWPLLLSPMNICFTILVEIMESDILLSYL